MGWVDRRGEAKVRQNSPVGRKKGRAGEHLPISHQRRKEEGEEFHSLKRKEERKRARLVIALKEGQRGKKKEREEGKNWWKKEGEDGGSDLEKETSVD